MTGSHFTGTKPHTKRPTKGTIDSNYNKRHTTMQIKLKRYNNTKDIRYSWRLRRPTTVKGLN